MRRRASFVETRVTYATSLRDFAVSFGKTDLRTGEEDLFRSVRQRVTAYRMGHYLKRLRKLRSEFGLAAGAVIPPHYVNASELTPSDYLRPIPLTGRVS